MVIFFKKGNRQYINNYIPICLISHMYKLFTEIITTKLEKKLDENQPREQAGSRSKYSTTLFSTTPVGLNNLVQAVNKHSVAYKLSINAAKTKIMELDKWQENTNIVIDNINVERVQRFQYLGAMFTTNGDGASNIKQRLAMAVQARRLQQDENVTCYCQLPSEADSGQTNKEGCHPRQDSNQHG